MNSGLNSKKAFHTPLSYLRITSPARYR